MLRYSSETLGRFRSDDFGPRHPYVDYYVVRLWEDLIGLTPMVMQPVPDDLERFITADLPDRPDLDGDEEAWSAMIWHGGHLLDLGYLQNAPRVRAWRTLTDDDTVTVTWQHHHDDEIVFTAAPAGEVTVPADAYLTAVRQLDTELMAAMHDRITELERTGPPHGVRIDMDQLRAEHHDRTAVLADADAEGRIDWSMMSVDSTSCRAHQHAGGARRNPPRVPGKDARPGSTVPTRDSDAPGAAWPPRSTSLERADAAAWPC